MLEERRDNIKEETKVVEETNNTQRDIRLNNKESGALVILAGIGIAYVAWKGAKAVVNGVCDTHDLIKDMMEQRKLAKEAEVEYVEEDVVDK